MFVKIKNKVMGSKLLKKVMVVSGIISMVSATAVTASADSTFNVTGVMTSSFQTLVTDLLAMIAALLPIGLTVLGASIAIAFGIRWFKKITKG